MRKPNGAVLQLLFESSGLSYFPSIQSMVDSFKKKERTLIRHVDVEEECSIKIDTSYGAHVTADCVLDALKIQNDKKKSSSKFFTDAEYHDIMKGQPALHIYA